MKPVDVLLKEYETLRRDQATALRDGYRLVCYGLVALALWGSGTLLIIGEEALTGLVRASLCYAMPFLASLILLLWSGQVDRRRRLSDYLVTLEIDINDTLGKDAAVWENYIRHHRPLKYPDLAVIALLLGVIAGVPLLGQQVVGLELETFSVPMLVPWLLGGVVGIFVLTRVFRPREMVAIPRERLPWESDAPGSPGV